MSPRHVAAFRAHLAGETYATIARRAGGVSTQRGQQLSDSGRRQLLRAFARLDEVDWSAPPKDPWLRPRHTAIHPYDREILLGLDLEFGPGDGVPTILRPAILRASRTRQK